MIPEARRSEQRVELDGQVENASGHHADGHAHTAHRDSDAHADSHSAETQKEIGGGKIAGHEVAHQGTA